MKRPIRIVDSAVALEERLDLLEALLGDLQPVAVAHDELAAEPATEQEGREVAERRRTSR